MTLKEIIEKLQTAEEQGNVYDDPEGVRYIMISQTLKDEIITSLKEHLPTKIPIDDYKNLPSKEPKIIFFDTETSGFISKSKTFDDPEQAWTVQIGAILSDSKKIYEKLNIIIQPNGRFMNPHAEAVHGISVEYAQKNGISELEAINKFGAMMRKANIIVCHNYDFDWQYISHMMQRNIDNMSDEARSAFYLDLPSFCTMKDNKIKNFVGAKNKRGSIKWPKLIELHEKLFDKDFENAHDAFADIEATRNCFYELINQKVIESVHMLNKQ